MKAIASIKDEKGREVDIVILKNVTGLRQFEQYHEKNLKRYIRRLGHGVGRVDVYTYKSTRELVAGNYEHLTTL